MTSWQGWGEVGGTGTKQTTRMDQSEPFPKAFRHGTDDPASPLMEELASESEKKVPEQAIRRGRKLARQMSCEWPQAGTPPSALRRGEPGAQNQRQT